MTDNSKKLFNFLLNHAGEHVTAIDVAEETGLATGTVNLLFNNFIKKGWGRRTIATVEYENGSQGEVKFLYLTDEGMKLNPDDD